MITGGVLCLSQTSVVLGEVGWFALCLPHFHNSMMHNQFVEGQGKGGGERERETEREREGGREGGRKGQS